MTARRNPRRHLAICHHAGDLLRTLSGLREIGERERRGLSLAVAIHAAGENHRRDVPREDRTQLCGRGVFKQAAHGVGLRHRRRFPRQHRLQRVAEEPLFHIRPPPPDVLPRIINRPAIRDFAIGVQHEDLGHMRRLHGLRQQSRRIVQHGKRRLEFPKMPRRRLPSHRGIRPHPEKLHPTRPKLRGQPIQLRRVAPGDRTLRAQKNKHAHPPRIVLLQRHNAPGEVEQRRQPGATERRQEKKPAGENELHSARLYRSVDLASGVVPSGTNS